MKNIKIKCDIYTRVFTTMQVDGYNLDAQKEKLRRYTEDEAKVIRLIYDKFILTNM